MHPTASCIPYNKQANKVSVSNIFFLYFLITLSKTTTVPSHACIFDDGQNRIKHSLLINIFPTAFTVCSHLEHFRLIILFEFLFIFVELMIHVCVSILLYNMLAAAATNSTHRGNGKYKINFSNNLLRQRIS